jgi:hypothetical protein
MATPLPVEAPRPVDYGNGMAEPPRRVYCVHYDQCLDHALLNNWPSFQCDRCGVTEDISALQQQSDLHGIANIFESLMTPGEVRRKRRPVRHEEVDECPDT